MNNDPERALPAGDARPTAADPPSTTSFPTEHPGRGASKRRQLEYWLGHFAQFDLLTDLPNRRQFLDRLHGAIARGARSGTMVGVMMLNLDGFKAVNATYGLRAADLVLRTMADRLRSCTRASDSTARLGGDEFSVILEGLIDKEGANIAARRIQASFAGPLTIGADERVITVTAGVAFYPPDGATVDELLHHADVALVHAKRQGRGGSAFYSPELALAGHDEELRRAAVAQRVARLTPREREVLDVLVAGNANKMIAYMLGTSARTIENHRAHIMEKMEARSLPELVRMVLDVHRTAPATPPR